ncbi:hypothetical protein LAZ67_14001546 [Cordylochernes scorpioides]|uniref:Zinc finger BED domain-containing protein 5 n=1 Tax=Cordylochernes scorpioides TaxID=51811 RepID=A0ABY6L648_9ARAC|nr:hypothetical protein LAZ67_14001546 [Cordylochernes scorpioides]
MDSDYKNVLFHTEVRWLSKGKVLNRFISMKNEIMAFIDNEEINFPFMMSDVWWLRVSFLGDIFDKLNSLNLNLQGAQENIITISTKLKAFKEKLSLWNLNIAKENFASFPMVQENPSKSIIKKEVEETLTLLSASFDKYFPYLDVEKMEWVVNPFMHCEIQHLEEEMQENLIDLKNDLVFKRLFTEKELSEFWLCLNSKFPKLSNAAIESLLPFGSSYLCEQGFSTLTEMKSKKRERLQMIDEEMRVCLSQGGLCFMSSTRNLMESSQSAKAGVVVLSPTLETSSLRRRDFWCRFVTVDETWIHHYIPESKQQSKHWTGPGKRAVVSAGEIDYGNCQDRKDCFSFDAYSDFPQSQSLLNVVPFILKRCLQTIDDRMDSIEEHI